MPLSGPGPIFPVTPHTALPLATLGTALAIGLLAGFGSGMLTWLVYAAFLFLRYEAGWRGRRAAYVALAGFALVVVVRLGLPITHFA